MLGSSGHVASKMWRVNSDLDRGEVGTALRYAAHSPYGVYKDTFSGMFVTRCNATSPT